MRNIYLNNPMDIKVLLGEYDKSIDSIVSISIGHDDSVHEYYELGKHLINFHFIQPIKDRILLLGSRTYKRSNGSEKNAVIVDKNGMVYREMCLGDGIEDCIVISDGRIITSYFDEGILPMGVLKGIKSFEGRTMMFIKQVAEQLNRMSEAEKEEWILSQARLLSERKQQDFLMSLSGEKKVIYMPSQREIEEFCEKVERGEIYLEYETHYYEFDDSGRYMDDWEVWHNDPSGAMLFLDRTFKGCHDLLILNEYKTVADILDRVCRLEFQVVEAEDSEDFEVDSPFTVVDAAGEGMLSVDIRDAGTDWVTSVVRMTDKWESLELANILVRIFKQPVCRKINPSVLIGEAIPEGLFPHMLNILNAEISATELMLNKMFSEITYSHEKYLFEEKLKRDQEIALDIRLKCIEAVQK